MTCHAPTWIQYRKRRRRWVLTLVRYLETLSGERGVEIGDSPPPVRVGGRPQAIYVLGGATLVAGGGAGVA